MTRHLLLVDSVPDGASAALADVPGLDVTAVTGLVAARAYLAGSAFDAVAVQAGVDPDDAVGPLAEGLGVSIVVRYDDVDSLAAEVIARLGLVRPSGGSGVDTSRPEPVGPVALDPGAFDAALADLREEIGRVAHDLANPLAVVMGNAQLGAEIAHATGADEALGHAFTDIGEAAAELDRRIALLAALRGRIDGMTRHE